MGAQGAGASPTGTDPPRSPRRTVNVWVTGFDAFKDITVNPSYLIARALPQLIALDKKSCDIRVLCHPEPVRVAYQSVFDLTRQGIARFQGAHDGQAPDLVLHIGVTNRREYYSVESHACRDGYMRADVEERTAADIEALFRERAYPEALRPGDEPHTQDGQPCSVPRSTVLQPSPVDESLVEAWSLLSPGLDVRLSHDAGRYVCEFIYYNSLVHAWEQGRPLSVVFVHVPVRREEGDVEKGKDAVTGLIKAIVDRWLE
ncbi:hypothetical protein KEM52_006689 [Ascosphaera acerosa]|nr:hypothetical protein KEM52_006689 [Ascosphaera acerosa]